MVLFDLIAVDLVARDPIALGLLDLVALDLVALDTATEGLLDQLPWIRPAWVCSIWLL